jgi:hypothetical protein
MYMIRCSQQSCHVVVMSTGCNQNVGEQKEPCMKTLGHNLSIISTHLPASLADGRGLVSEPPSPAFSFEKGVSCPIKNASM